MRTDKTEYLLLYHCAPTLLKKKSANLFSLSGTSKMTLPYIIKAYSHLITSLDLKVVPLFIGKDSALVYVYNETLLARILNTPEISVFLAENGYSGCRTTEEYLSVLKSHLNGGDFPHEIGIFLDYPLHDVIGFIQNSGKNFILCGDWKVYSDKSSAAKRFRSYKKCRVDMCRKISSGLSAHEILSMEQIS